MWMSMLTVRDRGELGVSVHCAWNQGRVRCRC